MKPKITQSWYKDCSARDWDRKGLLEEIPRSGVQISALLKGTQD